MYADPQCAPCAVEEVYSVASWRYHTDRPPPTSGRAEPLRCPRLHWRFLKSFCHRGQDISAIRVVANHRRGRLPCDSSLLPLALAHAGSVRLATVTPSELWIAQSASFPPPLEVVKELLSGTARNPTSQNYLLPSSRCRITFITCELLLGQLLDIRRGRKLTLGSDLRTVNVEYDRYGDHDSRKSA